MKLKTTTRKDLKNSLYAHKQTKKKSEIELCEYIKKLIFGNEK